MTRTGRLRVGLCTVAVSAAVSVTPATPAAAAPEIPVLTSPAGEFQPARTGDALAWEQNTRAKPNEYTVIVQRDGAAPLQANRPGTAAAMGDFTAGRLVYQQYRGNPRGRGRSGLHLFDIASGARSKVPEVNSRQWEYWPSTSGAWILFARWNPNKEVRRLFLYNLDTGERRILDRTKGRNAFLGPGQVNGNYAVWYACRPRCDVFRYDIAARAETMIANPGLFQRAPSVTSGGTVYFSRGGKRCGTSVSLVRAPVQGAQEELVKLQKGLDIGDTYAHALPDGTSEVYYERNVCGRVAASDIYKVLETSLATLRVNVEGSGTVISSPGGINCPPDCAEDYALGTTVTLGAHEAPDYDFAGWSGACTETAPCNVTMDASKEVTAHFVESGSITVRKTISSGDPRSFTFRTDPNISGGPFSLGQDGERTFLGLPTRSYRVTEVREDGWSVDITCLGGGTDTQQQQDGRTATVALDPGEAIRCTFVNEENDGGG
jgi:uncharacterized repeat protein (TIGR02543 family)